MSDAVLRLPRLMKRTIALAADIAMCLLSVWLAFYLRTGVFHMLHSGVLTAMAASVLIAVPIFIVSGLYRAVFRYEGFAAAVAIMQAMAGYTLIYAVIFTVIGVEKVPRTVGIIQPALLIVLVSLSRGLVRLFLSGEYKFHIRLIILFGVPAVLLSLMSFGLVGMRIIIPALIMFAGLAALYVALAVRGTTEE